MIMNRSNHPISYCVHYTYTHGGTIQNRPPLCKKITSAYYPVLISCFYGSLQYKLD